MQKEPSQGVRAEVSILTMCQKRSLCTNEITELEMAPFAHQVIVNTSYRNEVKTDEKFSSNPSQKLALELEIWKIELMKQQIVRTQRKRILLMALPLNVKEGRQGATKYSP